MKKINHGKRFEQDFVKSIPDRCDVTRLKDGGGWSNATNMRFTSKNPCDFIVYSEASGRMRKLELKSTQNKSLPFSNIKDHQLKSLCESQAKGVRACFVVNYRSVNQTYMVNASDMMEYIATRGRKSLPVADAEKIGVKIKQTKKITRWRYDLEWL